MYFQAFMCTHGVSSPVVSPIFLTLRTFCKSESTIKRKIIRYFSFYSDFSSVYVCVYFRFVRWSGRAATKADCDNRLITLKAPSLSFSHWAPPSLMMTIPLPFPYSLYPFPSSHQSPTCTSLEVTKQLCYKTFRSINYK